MPSYIILFVSVSRLDVSGVAGRLLPSAFLPESMISRPTCFSEDTINIYWRPHTCYSPQKWDKALQGRTKEVQLLLYFLRFVFLKAPLLLFQFNSSTMDP